MISHTLLPSSTQNCDQKLEISGWAAHERTFQEQDSWRVASVQRKGKPSLKGLLFHTELVHLCDSTRQIMMKDEQQVASGGV